MIERPWRVAVLGLGHWYSAFGLARALPESPRATLVAAARHNPTQLAEFASAFGVETPFSPVTPFPLDHLIDCLESGQPSPANIDEARKSFIVAMAADESAREGRPVHLTW